MILKIWLRLFLIVVMVVVPLMTAQYLMQKESIELVLSVSEKGGTADFMTSYMEKLKQLSHLDADHSETYRAESSKKAAEARNVVEDLKLVRANIVNDVLTQTLRNTLIVLLLALIVTYFISRGIVALLKRLIAENQDQSLRLESLGALESWQKVARMMVHEMRAPITPIKLIATDIESQYRSLDAAGFQRYLAKGTELIRSQVNSIERLTESLTRFAKLPEVRKEVGAIDDFFRRFTETHREYQVDINVEAGSPQPIAFDTGLLDLLFYNQLKNAVEANPGREIQVRLSRAIRN